MRRSKWFFIPLAFVLITMILWSTNLVLSDMTIYGPKKFVRSTGKPIIVTENFSAPSTTTYNLIVFNGEKGKNRVSSATVKINGIEILRESDFNQQVDRIERSVSLLLSNNISVELKSAPGSFITVSILGINHPPIADAGPDQTVYVGDTVQLDGSKSSDVDGDLLTFHWSFTSRPAGSMASLSDPSAVKPTFVLDVHGSYLVQLIVNDVTVDSDSKTVTITTQNSKPVANAGPDQTVYVGDTVQLDGSKSSDMDGDPLSLLWSFASTPIGCIATLSDPTAISPTFRVDLPGIYVVQLIVNDGTVDSTPKTMTVTTTNSSPVANAGPDQTVFVGYGAQLDGSASSDADKDPLNFFWSIISKPDGSTSDLNSPTAINPTFIPDLSGLYIGQLIVNDGKIDSYPDTTTVTANLKMVTVPDVVGMDEAAAQSAILAVNLELGTLAQRPSTSVPTGKVISQEPVAGTLVSEGSSVKLVISLGPPPAVIFSANPQTIDLGGSSTLSWSIIGATSTSIDQGVGSVNPTIGSTNVTPALTTIYTLTAIGPGGTATAQVAVTVKPTLVITIISPSDGETVNKAKTIVKGTINSSTRDVGIAVNGILAEIAGNNWIANNIPLAIGSNTITAVATDSYGNTASKTITVNTNDVTQFVELSANITSGIPPLQVYFSVSTPFTPVSYQMDFEGEGVNDYNGATFNNISYTYTSEGIFYPKVMISDNQGNTFSDTISIAVLSKTEMDTLLKGKWEGMKQAMINRDVGKAGSYFADWTRDRYTGIFSALGDRLPQIAQDMQNIRMIYLIDGVAKYRIRRMEEAGEITYYIYFVQDENGLWKIQQF